MTITTRPGWRLEVLGEKRWWLVIDDPLTEVEQDGELTRRLGDVELPPGTVVVVSRLHAHDGAAGQLDRVEAQLVSDGLVGDGLVLRNEPMVDYLPPLRMEPIERPWLDQRRCRPRKLKRWRKRR